MTETSHSCCPWFYISLNYTFGKNLKKTGSYGRRINLFWIYHNGVRFATYYTHSVALIFFFFFHKNKWLLKYAKANLSKRKKMQKPKCLSINTSKKLKWLKVVISTHNNSKFNNLLNFWTVLFPPNLSQRNKINKGGYISSFKLCKLKPKN